MATKRATKMNQRSTRLVETWSCIHCFDCGARNWVFDWDSTNKSKVSTGWALTCWSCGNSHWMDESSQEVATYGYGDATLPHEFADVGLEHPVHPSDYDGKEPITDRFLLAVGFNKNRVMKLDREIANLEGIGRFLFAEPQKDGTWSLLLSWSMDKPIFVASASCIEDVRRVVSVLKGS